MNSTFLKWPALLFAGGIAARLLAGDPPPEETSAVLTNVAQVLRLTAEQAARSQPVRLRASVTYLEPEGGVLFVEDATGGIFVGAEQRLPSLRLGQVVEVRGQSDPGLHLRAITRASILPHAENVPLDAVAAGWAELSSGALDCRFVEVRGTVRALGERNGRFALTMECAEDQRVEVSFAAPGRPTNLIDAIVRVRGVAGLRGMQDGRVISALLYANTTEQVSIEKPGLSDAFAGPLAEPDQVFQAAARRERVRVRGTFTGLSVRGELVLTNPGSASLFAHTAALNPARTNDIVEACGIPRVLDNEVILEHAAVRVLAVGGRTNAVGQRALLPVISTAAQVRQMSPAAANEMHPVRLRGVVTYHDRWHLFVQDETAGIYVYTAGKHLKLRAGQLVDVEGFTGAGEFAPLVREPRVTPLQEGFLPIAKTVTFGELMDGSQDSQRVQIAGTVHSVTNEGSLLALDVVASRGHIRTLVLLNGEPAPTNLVDSAVTLTGVCASSFNQKRQIIGVVMCVPSLGDMRLDRAAPANPFSGETRPVTSLLQFGNSAEHRVKVSGTITFVDARASMLCLQDAEGGVFVYASEPLSALAVGDRVEVAGFTSREGFTPVLTEALVRRMTGKGAVVPRAAVAEELVQGSFDAELVTTRARLLQKFTRASKHVFVLQGGQTVFEAQAKRSGIDHRTRGVQSGALLDVSGVCAMEGNDPSRPRGFRLLLRVPGDVELIEAAPWWNDDRARWLIGSVLALLVMAMFWGVTLRRKVQQQTAVIREQLEREKQTNDELEYKVEKRTAELSRTNEQLTQEIEQRCEADSTLAYERDLFHVIMEHMPSAIFFKDAAGCFTRINKALAEQFKLARAEDVAGKTDRDFFLPEQAEQFRAREMEIMRTGGAMMEIEERGTLEGCEWWGVTTKLPWRDRSGDVIGVFGISHDITRRKHAEEELQKAHEALEHRVAERTRELSEANAQLVREIAERQRAVEALRSSEDKFAKAFHSSPYSIGITTLAEGRILDVNRSFCLMMGFTPEEVRGRTVGELNLWVRPEDRAKLVERVRADGGVRDFETQFRTKDGNVRQAIVAVESVQLENESCLLFMTQDVSDRVNLETQLRHAQKLEAVGQLAAGVAHDFNNILTIIQGHVSLLTLRHGEQQGERAGSLAEITQAADRAANLTRQLLTFSRRQLMQARELDLNDVISGMGNMLRRTLGEQIKLHFHHCPSLPAIFADQGMVEQIILNLAVNARDAMPQGGRLTFETFVQSVDAAHVTRNPEACCGRYVRLSVTDTGCGIAPDVLARIFEPFFTTKEVGKGTGLGLATVHGIAKQHRGWIEVTSEVGQGTTFNIFLPALEKVAEAGTAAASAPPLRGGDETILLVEDEAGVRDLAQNVLRRQGYRVLTAANGREALDVWETDQQGIDLLLTDMVMPEGVTGRQLAEQLRTDRPGLKVIYTSGYSMDLEEGLSLHDGINFLPKPYPARKLVQTVRECLDV